jgi:predicted RNase H-like HicB family nuclease
MGFLKRLEETVFGKKTVEKPEPVYLDIWFYAFPNADGVWTAAAFKAPVVAEGNTYEEAYLNLNEQVDIYLKGLDAWGKITAEKLTSIHGRVNMGALRFPLTAQDEEDEPKE